MRIFRKYRKFTAIFCTIAFIFVNETGYALAPWLAFQSPAISREISFALEHSHIIYAKSPEDIQYLKDHNNAKAMLREDGKYLVDAAYEDATKIVELIRLIIHEDVEAYMQILAKSKERYKYTSIKELFARSNVCQAYYDLCFGGKEPYLDEEMMLNDMVAKALELEFVNKYKVFQDQEVIDPVTRDLEDKFYAQVAPLIRFGQYFRHGLYVSPEDSLIRKNRIRKAISKGFVFRRAASSAYDQGLEESEYTRMQDVNRDDIIYLLLALGHDKKPFKFQDIVNNIKDDLGYDYVDEGELIIMLKELKAQKIIKNHSAKDTYVINKGRTAETTVYDSANVTFKEKDAEALAKKIEKAEREKIEAALPSHPAQNFSPFDLVVFLHITGIGARSFSIGEYVERVNEIYADFVPQRERLRFLFRESIETGLIKKVDGEHGKYIITCDVEKILADKDLLSALSFSPDDLKKKVSGESVAPRKTSRRSKRTDKKERVRAEKITAQDSPFRALGAKNRTERMEDMLPAGPDGTPILKKTIGKLLTDNLLLGGANNFELSQVENARNVLRDMKRFRYRFVTRDGEAMFVRRFVGGLRSEADMKESFDITRGIAALDNENFRRLVDLLDEIAALTNPYMVFSRSEIKGTFVEILLSEYKESLKMRDGNIVPDEGNYYLKIIDEKTVMIKYKISEDPMECAKAARAKYGQSVTARDRAFAERIVSLRDMKTPERIEMLRKAFEGACAILNENVLNAENSQLLSFLYAIRSLQETGAWGKIVTVIDKKTALDAKCVDYASGAKLLSYKQGGDFEDIYVEGEAQNSALYEPYGRQKRNEIGYAINVHSYKVNDDHYSGLSLNDLTGFLDFYIAQARLLRAKTRIVEKDTLKVYRRPGRDGVHVTLPYISRNNDGIMVKEGHMLGEENVGDRLFRDKLAFLRKKMYMAIGHSRKKNAENASETAINFDKTFLDAAVDKFREQVKLDPAMVKIESENVSWGEDGVSERQTLNAVSEIMQYNESDAYMAKNADHWSSEAALEIMSFCDNMVLLEDIACQLDGMPEITDILKNTEQKPASEKEEKIIDILLRGDLNAQDNEFYAGLDERLLMRAARKAMIRDGFRHIPEIGINLYTIRYVCRYKASNKYVVANAKFPLSNLAFIALDQISSLRADMLNKDGEKLPAGYNQFVDVKNSVNTVYPEKETSNTFLFHKLAFAGSIVPAREFSMGRYRPQTLFSKDIKGSIAEGTSGFTSILKESQELAQNADNVDGFESVVYMESGLFAGRTDARTSRAFLRAIKNALTAYGFKVVEMGSLGNRNKAEVMAEKFYGYLIKARMKNWPALKTMSIYARKLLGIDLDEEDLVAADAEKLNKPKHFYSWKTAEWAELFGLKEYEYAGLKRKDKERMMQHRDPRTSENAVLQAIFGRDPIPDGFYDESSGRGRNNVNGTPNADWFFGAKGRDADKAALEFKRFRGQHPLLYNMLFPKPGRAVQNLSLLKSLAAKNKNSRQQIKKSLKTLSALIGSSQQNGVLEEISLNETDGIVDLNGFYMYERVSEGAYDIFSSLQSAHAIEPVDNNLHGNFGRLVVSEESLHAVREAIKRMERYEHEDDLDRRDYDGDLSEEDQGHDNGADTPCTRILRNYERYITAKLENQDMFSKFYRNETRLFLAAVRQFATLTKNLSFEEKDWCFYMNKFLSEIIKDNKISDNIRALAVTINVLEDAISTVDLMEERSGVLPEISASVANGGEMDTKGIAHPAIDKKTAVRNDIKVEAGKTIFLVGPNASGKTVLLKSIISAAAGMSSGTPVVADKISGSAFKHVLLLSPESFFKWEETKKPDPFEIFLARTRYAIENADKDTIVIIDELGVGCDDALIAPFYCAAIEAIAATGAALVVASHREDLLSTISGRVNNVSVYESVTDENGIPTYKFKETQIVTDMGKHGLAAAKKMGWKLMAYLSVNPVEMLRKMYEFCGSGKISEGDLAENMEIMGFENDLGVLKAAMRFLVSAGIVTKDNEGYAIADYIIGDKDEASENIGLIYDMETPGGEPISESELDAKDARYFKEKTALMFSQKDISNILGEGPHDTKILKVWSGYASTDRDRKMLQLIRAYGKENGYEINFGNITENDESIKEMVDFAISGEGRSGLAVTIIPLDHPYVREHLAALKSSRVIFMDIERKGFSEESFTQLIGIVGAGIAYLQDKDNVFRHLYRILTGKDTNITLEELRKDPAKIVFMIKPAEIYDPEQLADLYRNAEMFLTKA